MTELEQKFLINQLHYMQNELEKLMTHEQNTTIMVLVPGTDIKHVYSGDLAISVCRSLARTMEAERMKLVTRRRKENTFVS